MPHAFLVRHADGVAFRDCRIRWDGATGEWGSALRVVGSRDVDCRSLRADPFGNGDEAITAADSVLQRPAAER